MATVYNVTEAAVAAQPNMGGAQFASHTWLEPIIVLTIMITSLTLNRRHNFRILDSNRGRSTTRSLLPHDSQASSPDGSVDSGSYLSGDSDVLTSTKYPPKKRNCCGMLVRTPNSSRFADHIHSRILAKFPFLIEMFYWVLNLLFYVLTKAIAQTFFSNYDGLRELAQDHGVLILDIEHKSWLSFLFPIQERDFQAWFLNGHLTAITFLNRIYSLVHIPGTVTFLSWYYYSAPNHDTFAVVRRTMTLGNFFAFAIFTVFPTMPPRLLPKEYGFHDTVRQADAESVWVGGNYVNQLAAMPSLHFTYAFVIGCTFLYHSGLLRRTRNEPRKSIFTQTAFSVVGILYPLLVLTVIVATANHYYLDAVVAMITVSLSLLANKVWMFLLPAEDILCWVLRVDKPVPTTGDRLLRQQGAKYQPVKDEEDP
ncbi:PAP2 superfamily-domain-containing protein [Exophiala viscosa]|uniref:PAP2 superfamily-domain-containing protein n=1 Tax=Exophiala viscosa TaxID=2486360 RepID=A0AAN6I8J6_9EURO|nr:PAP2 superfamily-domain-containing protein [Exophiala viscosa]